MIGALAKRQKRRDAGKCRYCSEPALPDRSTCAKHSKSERERKASSSDRAGTQHCKICGGTGHNRRRHRKAFGGSR